MGESETCKLVRTSQFQTRASSRKIFGTQGRWISSKSAINAGFACTTSNWHSWGVVTSAGDACEALSDSCVGAADWEHRSSHGQLNPIQTDTLLTNSHVQTQDVHCQYLRIKSRTTQPGTCRPKTQMATQTCSSQASSNNIEQFHNQPSFNTMMWQNYNVAKSDDPSIRQYQKWPHQTLLMTDTHTNTNTHKHTQKHTQTHTQLQQYWWQSLKTAITSAKLWAAFKDSR